MNPPLIVTPCPNIDAAIALTAWAYRDDPPPQKRSTPSISLVAVNVKMSNVRFNPNRGD